MIVNLESDRSRYTLGIEDLKQSRKEGASAERGIQKSDFLFCRKPPLGKPENLKRQLRRRSKLPEAVALFLSLFGVAFPLNRYSLSLNFSNWSHQMPNSIKSSILCSHTQSIPSAA